MMRFSFNLFAVVALSALASPLVRAAGDSASDARAKPIEVESVVLRLFEEAEVPAQEKGLVVSVGAQDGQRVKQGDLLAQIDDQVPRMVFEAARAKYDIASEKAKNDIKVRYARKAVEVSEAELKRSTESVEKYAKSVSQSQLDVERLTVQKNRLEAEEAQHEQAVATLEMKAQEVEVNAARAEIMRRKIMAPFDGVIAQVYLRKGEWAEPGQKALRIVNTDRLKAEGFIRADDAISVAPGSVVQLVVDLAGKPTVMSGKVAFVSPEVDPITGQVRVWADIENKEGKLRPGLAAKMRIGG